MLQSIFSGDMEKKCIDGMGGGSSEAGNAITNWRPSVRFKHNSAEEQNVEAGICYFGTPHL